MGSLLERSRGFSSFEYGAIKNYQMTGCKVQICISEHFHLDTDSSQHFHGVSMRISFLTCFACCYSSQEFYDKTCASCSSADHLHSDTFPFYASFLGTFPGLGEATLYCNKCHLRWKSDQLPLTEKFEALIEDESPNERIEITDCQKENKQSKNNLVAVHAKVFSENNLSPSKRCLASYK